MLLHHRVAEVNPAALSHHAPVALPWSGRSLAGTAILPLLLVASGMAAHAEQAGGQAPQASPPKACEIVDRNVRDQVKAKPELLLAIVDAQITAHPDCACEVIKAAIQASQASGAQIGQLVEVATLAAPERLRMIAQCAIAVAPDSLPQVQAVLAKLDPAAGDGDYSSKSSKGSKDAKDAEQSEPEETFNPLNFIGPPTTWGGGRVPPPTHFPVTDIDP